MAPEESGAADFIPSYFYQKEGVNTKVLRLRGSKMRTTAQLMSEFGAAGQFFEGFGENYHALGDCLDYLGEWMPADGYVMLFTGIDELLVDEPESALASLLLTLQITAENWSQPIEGNGHFDRPPKPFHSLFLLPKGDPASAIERFKFASNKDRFPHSEHSVALRVH